MRLRPFQFVLFLAAYLPLEEFILKWIPVSDLGLLLLHQVPDLLLGILSFFVLCDRLMRFRGLRGFGRGFDWMLALFLVSATLTLFLNPNAAVGPWFANLKALFRYVLLAYIVHTYQVSPRDRERLVRVLLTGVWIQIVIGLAQFVGGLRVRDFLAARSTTAELAGIQMTDFTGTRFEGVNNLMGTMGSMINYGAFLVVGIVLFLCCVPREKAIQRWTGVALSFLCIYLANSRSALIAGVVVILCYLYMYFGKRVALLLLGATLVCLVLGALVLAGGQSARPTFKGEDYHSKARFFQIFSGDYVEAAKGARLGLLIYLAPDFLEDPVGAPFGYTPDPNVVVEIARKRYPDVPEGLILVLSGIIEDVYWLAIMIHYGVIGFLLFFAAVLWSIRTLARRFRKENDPGSRRFALVALLLMIVCLPLNCFNQVFLMRQFSFCLWISFGLTFLPMKNLSAADTTQLV